MEIECKPNSNLYKQRHNNSDKPKPDEKKKEITKVVSGNVKVKKNVFGNIISDDAKNVKSYVVMDILIPAIKKAVSDIVKDGIDIILYGGTRKRSNTKSNYISYNTYYSSRRDDDRDSRNYSTKNERNVDVVVFDRRDDAEEVLFHMDEILKNYGLITIADYNDLVGIPGQYTDNRFGWTSIRNARVVHSRDGYIIELPRATVI